MLLMGPSVEQKNRLFSNPACEMVILLKKGRISRIVGMEKVKAMPSVIHVVQFHKENSIIDDTGTLDQSFARFQIVASDEEDLKEQIRIIYSVLHIYDENGNDMIVHADI